MNLCKLDHAHKHGQANCYDAGGCRCTPCRDGNSARSRHIRRLKAYGQWEGIVPALGSQRRIQGLQVLGFTFDQIAEAANANRHTVWRVLTEKTVEPKTRDRINKAYKTLLRNPTGGASKRTAILSKRKGYVSPFAWEDIDADLRPVDAVVGAIVDDVAVTIALTGTRVALTADERRAAVTKLHAEKWSDPLIAETLHCASETVQRDRRKLGLDAWPYDQLEKRGAA